MNGMETLLTCLLVGLVAQAIDGALGMAYGVSCSTFLLSIGIAPAVAVASVKTAEVFTTAVSGISHLRLGNVDRRLFLRLAVPGVVGGVLGAYVLCNVPGERVKPFIAAYLVLMGVVIIEKAFRKTITVDTSHRQVEGLGFFGGLMDAVGGGGWGPIVSSTLMARGKEPRMAIGSVNLAEFFVTIAQSATFTALLGFQHGKVVLGLILGGVLAAPFAAYAARHIPARALMIAVGVVVILLSLRTILLTLKD
jgi:uncharacterized protein